MYLSRLELNTTSRETMKALASPSRLHGAVENSFAGERARRLWRLDTLNGKMYMLIVSEDRPDLSECAEQFGFAGRFETKDYSPLLNKIQNGGRWHFRLAANPTICLKTDDKDRKSRRNTVPLTNKFQKEWLQKRAEVLGFSLDSDEFETVGTKWYNFYKKEGKKSLKVCFLSVTFEGILTVTDAAKFKETLCLGIGREKAYGQGMLTIVGVKNG